MWPSCCWSPECRQDDQGVHGQEIRQFLARGDRRGLRLRGHARGEKPALHVLRRESGRVCVEVLLAYTQTSELRPPKENQPPVVLWPQKVTEVWLLLRLGVKNCDIKSWLADTWNSFLPYLPICLFFFCPQGISTVSPLTLTKQPRVSKHLCPLSSAGTVWCECVCVCWTHTWTHCSFFKPIPNITT